MKPARSLPAWTFGLLFVCLFFLFVDHVVHRHIIRVTWFCLRDASTRTYLFFYTFFAFFVFRFLSFVCRNSYRIACRTDIEYIIMLYSQISTYVYIK